MWQEHLIVEDYKQEEHTKAFIYDRAEVVLELFGSSREKNVRQIIDQLHAKNFGSESL